MEIVANAIFVGVLGTIAMDLLNHAFSKAGILVKIDVKMIGRTAAGWVHGRFFYADPSELKSISNEGIYGYIAHYMIGIGLALPLIFGWYYYSSAPVTPQWAFVYGIATTAASYFFVYPSMGLGILGMRSSQGIRAPISSLANHTFYGIGLAAGAAVT